MMYKALIIAAACLFGAALAQSPQPGDHHHHDGSHPHPSWFDLLAFKLNGLDDTIDRIHNLRIEYHHVANHTHLMIAIKDEWPRECHFIEIDPQWEPLLQDPIKVQQISEEIYHLVHGGHVPETELTPEQLLAKYDDNDAVEECTRHVVKVMSYTPSPSIQG